MGFRWDQMCVGGEDLILLYGELKEVDLMLFMGLVLVVKQLN